MKTFLPKTSEIKRAWYEADASKFTLGRLATRIATILRGKHKVTFTPHMDVGDFVVVKNAEKIKFTGRKLDQKQYYRFSGYPGGIYKKSLKERMEKEPEKVIRDAVYNMVDKNRLRKDIMRRLKVVKGDKHSFPITRNI
ncbi:MAG: 50S ribosomal protein L13 [Candidatus Doudnabacteria bacterium RIFCSPLOWO2_02_FULL_42_9]|uniref:Large ribosomal subunit protein uL13 n=1 Tax=Candidatus Doudnabacteria bacterium RIFCSPHIGHO2_01_FULL_41_86 TaxID=1817821 RepID=A0A1F5N7H1_9BACT|nr:MAG: 50S ribosomal protein L13 [Candidatus Doudnabacteria bacterium RIFCSPHIGHO2_01_FULL_41_86]OGE75685.1 MAG: 50S ribosomal protein L13 [Candidatus Doudnabacteria bacterium RIFCSPHIGHO2_01_43_10]OGE85667.1 MAG: 50S ribosomal protein L13 [Candidatus Doudnabacteria bacterium RIFCSPHIGHO2_12_FULL_42_22]OGE87163.1 MAG: 50S ribosomal protein L13 [Candidatus Doudnabacteria bacterium RIFCSPHIGHO2_02_FULL_42_25]OGE92001.1 MAG: 50S ribosomal protein L13 [Candidatus Doudnabacteria bacterium RIFCSPLOW